MSTNLDACLRDELLGEFLVEARDHLTRAERLAAVADASSDEIYHSHMRALHSIKGTAGALGLEDISNKAHCLEDSLASKADQRRPFPGFLDPEFVRSWNSLRDAIEEIDLSPRALAESERGALNRTSSLFRRVELAARDCSERTGQPIRCLLNDRQVILTEFEFLPLASAMEHLVRNSAAHGFEGAAQRRALAKPETGTIVVSLRRTAHWTFLAFRDDGRGLPSIESTSGPPHPTLSLGGERVKNWTDSLGGEGDGNRTHSNGGEGVKNWTDSVGGERDGNRTHSNGGERDGNRTLEKRMESQRAMHEPRGHRSRHDVLFQPGFTSARTVSRIAGRGIGLDAVRHAAIQLGGSVRLLSRPGRGASICLRWPNH